jgi:hypothetical protein
MKSTTTETESIYSAQCRARAQGFFYAVTLILPTWPQRGYIMWPTEEQAICEGEEAVARQSAHGYRVNRCGL